MDVNIAECLSRVDVAAIAAEIRELPNDEIQRRMLACIELKEFHGYMWVNLLEFHITHSISHIHSVCRAYLISRAINAAASKECGWKIKPIQEPYTIMDRCLMGLDQKFQEVERAAVKEWIANINI